MNEVLDILLIIRADCELFFSYYKNEKCLARNEELCTKSSNF